MEIKLCGTRSPTDVSIASTTGATEIGVIVRLDNEVYRPRPWRITHTVDIKTGGRVLAAAQGKLTTVLVPRAKRAEDIALMVEALKPDRVQLGEVEDAELTKAIYELPERPAVAQVIHVDDDTRPEVIDPFLDYVDMIHLDSAGKQPGGNGITHDWEVSRAIGEHAREAGKLVMLAGGLNASNVAEAITAVHPDGVDVETGIKSDHGTHSYRRALDFVRAVENSNGTVVG